MGESYKPPASAVKAAKKGLAQRKEWGRGGLSPSEAKAQGIDSGVTRARKIASGSVSRHDVRRMSAFNRHRKNNRPDKKMPDGGPTAGTIAWNLWGGTSGVNWAKKKSAAMNAETFGVEFDDWADQEMMTHGKNISFHDWAKEEGKSHGDMELMDWAEEEEGSHDKRYGAESERYRQDYMVPADIHKIIESAVQLQQLSDVHEGSYPEWWKSKLSVVASQLDNLADVLDYKVDHPEEFDAETLDYNSFTNDMEDLLAKYSQLLLTYETEYHSKERGGDGIMEVFMRFKPYNAYFDDVDFDAESASNPEIPEIISYQKNKYSMDLVVEYRGRKHDLELMIYQGYDAEDYAYPCEYCEQGGGDGVRQINLTNIRLDDGDAGYKMDICDSCLEKWEAGVLFYPMDAAAWLAGDWAEAEEGQLAKALAAVREKSKRYAPTPLRLTKLPHPDQKTLKDFEADEWKLLPRDSLGRWQKPVRSESINELRESLQTSVPAISELLEMYGGDTPNNRYKLYNDLQSLKIDAMDSALPDDSTVKIDMTDTSWMTPSEYYEYVLEESLDIPEDIEDDTQTIEFQERLVRYTAMTMTPQEIGALIEENKLEIISDLFADPAEAEGEIAFLKAVERYQQFSEQYSAE